MTLTWQQLYVRLGHDGVIRHLRDNGSSDAHSKLEIEFIGNRNDQLEALRAQLLDNVGVSCRLRGYSLKHVSLS